MEQSNVRYLKTLLLKSRPVSPHALAWSCDAEIAVATDDTLYIFFPEYPKLGKDGESNDADFGQHQFTLSFRASGVVKPDPAINAQLCADAGVKIPGVRVGGDTSFHGVGGGAITGRGGSTSQFVALAWSPNGLGCCLRPILSVLLTNGCLVMMGEHIEPRSTMNSSLRGRSFKCWKMLWGLGARLPVPDARRERGYRTVNDRICSFAWAREVYPGRALLAYMNDRSEVVVVSVRFEPKGSMDGDAIWQVQEMARFNGSGPHSEEDYLDPDFVPHGTAFALKWSPWLVGDHGRTATLAYVAKNYVGFRRVTISGIWERGHAPEVAVDEQDATSICLSLSPDAFVEWEDAIWTENGGPVGRGIIATPFAAKPFQVAMAGELHEPPTAHTTLECSTLYPPEEDVSVNPITSLVIHRPDPLDKPDAPLYSLTRLSATGTNREWYETSLPETTPLPQWVDEIGQQTTQLLPRVKAMAGAYSDSESDSDLDEDEDEKMVDLDSTLHVHPYRYRIWGMASSPGDGCTAVLASKYNTQHQERAGAVRVMFGWPVLEDGAQRRAIPGLTTEGRLWEWLYGRGADIPGLARRADGLHSQLSPPCALFKDVIPTQRCELCHTGLRVVGTEACCENGHSFATCATTGLAIMRPSISRICAVCGLRCLNVSEQARIARLHLGEGVVLESSGEVCGRCGGKFVA
ncbi:hypothetical protein B0I35DRAFT_472839 [Stachybotrys elegans]|uniref:Transcription factor IIIC 90kDa subunit N-terminal domain-containing protein n=1 Tax=Stachybotrys elegans TaxID=80388 RepID=A0A8K0T6P1_9HYPO|nr:hypothetical protein B0I35DRAFT_472839 [Stachybotrys elegans]